MPRDSGKCRKGTAEITGRWPVFTAAAVQAAPVYLNRDATVDKACALIREAGRAGARLIAFPALLGWHRKLMPTYAEKMIWSFGDGSTLRVYDTEVGRLGTLCCGENTNPLARFALIAKGEQVHVANYPARPAGDAFDLRHAIQIRSAALVESLLASLPAK